MCGVESDTRPNCVYVWVVVDGGSKLTAFATRYNPHLVHV